VNQKSGGRDGWQLIGFETSPDVTCSVGRATPV
jgi:hypothetical protein